MRAPLLHALRQKKGAQAARVQQCKSMMDDIRSWRTEMSQMALDVRGKEERVAVLTDEVRARHRLSRALFVALYSVIGSRALFLAPCSSRHWLCSSRRGHSCPRHACRRRPRG